MKSWNWRIVEFSASHHAWLAEIFDGKNSKWKPSDSMARCTKKGCTAKPEVYVAYDYVTGRQGRVSSAERQFCRPHAEELIAAKAGAA